MNRPARKTTRLKTKGLTTLFLIEDNPGDVGLVREAVLEANPNLVFKVAADGVSAMAQLAEMDGKTHPTPALILLDLNLPRVSGFEVLAFIKNSERLKSIPVIILSSSAAQSDIERAYQMGANAYLSKPTGFDELSAMMEVLERFWFQMVHLP